jgi:cytochrome c oxidase subunit II
LVDHIASPPQRPLPDGIIREEEITRTENRWVALMLAMLGIMMAVIVVTGVTHALNPPSNVETIDPTTLHLGGEFAESNLGSALEPDGSVTIRLVAEQYAFVPDCTQVPVDTPVKFRLTSTDVVHGFLLPATNVNTMVVPGFIAEVRASFSRPGIYNMPCHEFCGEGHHGMWARVSVLEKGKFPQLRADERTSCAKH